MNLLNTLRRHQLAAVIVGIPTILSAIYFGALASDVYVSESRFVIRSAQKPDASAGIGELFKGFAATGSENILLVRDYLLAREVMHLMDKRFQLRERYASGDLLSRFPAPWQAPTLEEFSSYYQDHIKLEVDANSAVGVLTVRAFDARHAHDINSALLKQAQDRIASLNAKIRLDTQEVANRELARAKARLVDADRQLASFRQQRGILDPERQAALELQGAQEINGKLVAAQARLDQAKRLAPLSPQGASLETEVKSIKGAAAQIRSTVSGAGADSRVSTAQNFQSLQLERELASRNLAAAHDALLRARVDAERQHLYLEAVSAPSIPDSALQPKRLRSFGAVVLMSLAVFAVVSLLRTGVREHGQSV